MSYTSIGEVFVEQERKIRQDENKDREKIPKDALAFRGQNKWEQPLKMPYEHIEEQENKRGKVTLVLNEMGKPPTEEPNVKVGQNIDYIYKGYPIMKDEYSRPKDRLKQDRL